MKILLENMCDTNNISLRMKISLPGLDKIGGYENLVPAYMNATPILGIENTTCGLPRSDAMSVLRNPATGDYPWPSMVLQCGVVSAWYWICDQVNICC